MDYWFRVDASATIGAGHFFRLLPLMEQLCSQNQKVSLVGDFDGLPFIEHYLNEIPLRARFNSASNWEPVGDCTLIIDSYEISVNDDIFAEKSWTRVVVIGDASTPKYKCDLFIGAGPVSKDFEDELKSRPGLRVAVGPEYFSLRKDLYAIKRKEQSDSSIPNILVIGGGGDVNGFTGWVAKPLKLSARDFSATIVTDDPLDSILELDARFWLQKPTNDLAALYRDASIVFSASGTTALECVALNIPVAVAQTSYNQMDQYRYLKDENLAFPLGDMEDYLELRESECPVDQSIEWCLLADRRLGRGLAPLLDGRGAQRIYKQFLAPGIDSL
jgi:UDP-2,4-diacetamido-2,4,6-trideoxy-beta-L-altropyranose hydrolase